MKKILAFLLIAAGTVSGWAAFNALAARAQAAGLVSESRHVLSEGEKTMDEKTKKQDQAWKNTLTAEQYKVLRQCGTERPFSGKYNDFWEEGTYYCAGCGAALFASKAKYEHGTGWPSFFEPIDASRLDLREDHSLLMERTEVRCAVCGGHLDTSSMTGRPPRGFTIVSIQRPLISSLPLNRLRQKSPPSPRGVFGVSNKPSAGSRASSTLRSATPEAGPKNLPIQRSVRTRPATPRPSRSASTPLASATRSS